MGGEQKQPSGKAGRTNFGFSVFHSTWRIVKNVVGFSRLGGGLCLSGTHSHIDVDLNDTSTGCRWVEDLISF